MNNVAYTDDAILLSLKQEGNPAFATRWWTGGKAKWNKPNTERQILCDLTCGI